MNEERVERKREAKQKKEVEQETSNKNLRQIILVILLTLLAVLLIYRAGWLSRFGIVPNKPQPSTPRLELNRYYTNPQYKYTFRYPATWKLMTPEDLEKFQKGFTGGIKRGKPGAIMGVKVSKISGRTNLRSLPKTLDKLMPRQFKKFQKVSSQMETVSGEKALKYVYTFTSITGKPVQQEQIIFVKNKNAYYLVFHTSQSGYSSLAREFEAIANSFVLQ